MAEESLVPMITECLDDLAETVSEVVPPIKFVGDVARIALSLPDRILWAKINRFLQAVPIDGQGDFVRRLKDDPTTRKKVAEHLVLTLDKMDEMEKAEILAKVFTAFAEQKISFETFKRLASSINAAFSGDLLLVQAATPAALEPFLGSLVHAGLAEVVAKQLGDAWNDHRVVAASQLNVLGKIFQQIMRDEPITGGVS